MACGKRMESRGLSTLQVLQGIASIAQACAALRHHPGELLDDIMADIERRPSEYERDDWTAVVWALTRLARSPGRLYARLAQEVSLVTQLVVCLRCRDPQQCNPSAGQEYTAVPPVRQLHTLWVGCVCSSCHPLCSPEHVYRSDLNNYVYMSRISHSRCSHVDRR